MERMKAINGSQYGRDSISEYRRQQILFAVIDDIIVEIAERLRRRPAAREWSN